MHLVRYSQIVAFLPRLLMRELIAQGSVVELEVSEWPAIAQPIYLSLRTELVSERFQKNFSEKLKGVLNGSVPKK